MTQHTSATGSREKRRHARKSTSQAVQLRFGEAAAIPAEIRDYCQTGLYTAFPGGRTPDAAIPVLVGTPVSAGFSVGQGDASRSHQLYGRVVRVAPGGVGIFVPAMPEAVLRALRAAGARSAVPGTSAEPELSPQQAQALQQECTGLFRRFLDAVMQAFFLQSMEQLTQAGQDEASFLERSRYEYGARELMQHRSRIEDEFFNAIRERIQHAGPVADADRMASAASTLALVDEAEFEDWLNLSAVIRQIEADIAPQLNEFEQRYSRLVGAPIDRKSNPFGPEMIGRAFQGAIQGLDFSNPMRTVLYKGLGQAVSNLGPALYQQLNQTLVSLQPLAPAHRKDKPGPVAAEKRIASDSSQARPDLAEIAETLNRLYKQDPASDSPMPESAEYSFDRILATLNQSPHRPAERARAGAPATRSSAHGGLPGVQAGASSDVLAMVNRLQQTARQLAGHDGQTRPVAAGGLPEVGLRELMAALESVPLTSQAAAAGSSMSASLAGQLDARIASMTGDGRRLAPTHRQILDTTSALFNQARMDFVPGSEVELLTKRLERPLLKLALQDTDFPSIPDHPARQVLNLIEQYAVAADDQGKFFDPKLQRFLYLLVDRVCSRADEDPGVFEMVRDSLEKVLLPIRQIRRTRVARLQEASEGRERIRSARSNVNAALEARLAGREVPGILLRLLDAGWRQYLVLLEMRNGSQSAAWEAGLAVLDQALDCLGPDTDVVAASAGSCRALQREIERALATVNVDAAMLASFMEELGASLTAGTAAAAAASAMVLVPRGKLASAQGRRDEAPAHGRLAERLRVGDWWNFSLEGSRVPMQLIWISEPPASCAFANRSATGKLEFTLAELSRQLQNGLAKPGKDLDLPLVERSEQALFDETYQSLIYQANHDPVSGLLNRKGFMQRLHAQAGPDEANTVHLVGVIEFDQFRLIHNTCGEDAVERLTRSLTEEVRRHIDPEAVLAVFQEDMLALLLPNCNRIAGCPAVTALLDGVRDYHFQHEPHSYRIGFNIGLSEYEPDRISAMEAIRRADSACITAKAQGRNRMQIYEQDSPQLQSQESLMDWAGRLDSVLQGSGLYLRCQKVMPIGADPGALPYYEILLGIEGDAGLSISPAHFIPAVERLQRSHEVDIWVLRKVFKWIATHPEIFASVGGFAINLSATSLSSPEVARYLQSALAASDFPADKIIFEITESAAIESYGAAQDFIREIRRHGCKFSLDDFGSGYTSYAHLKNLRTETLKIDGSFVKDMLLNPGDYAMVKSMNEIGHSLGMRTVAEYVETPEILDALREVGVDYVQGYAVHMPCRIDDILPEQALN